MILKALALGEIDGVGVSRRIAPINKGTFQVKPGSLFPDLHRMVEPGWLVACCGESENKRHAKDYKLTKAGRRQRGSETRGRGQIAPATTRNSQHPERRLWFSL